MFTAVTWQDWIAAGAQKRDIIVKAITEYKGSADFQTALLAQDYFRGDNPEIRQKTMLKAHKIEEKDERGKVTYKPIVRKEISGSRIPNGFFFRFVTQENQHLLSNGVILEDSALKERLGNGFDKTLERMGEKALVQGVCWGYWNMDHLEPIPAASDQSSGMVVLLDEISSEPMVGIQFWRLAPEKPMVVRVFEPDGLTIYAEDENGQLYEREPKRAYKQTVSRDAAGEMIVDAKNYAALPLVPLWANEEHMSELTPSIKAKIDAYDRIFSDFDDNLARANDVYWVLNNFGGSVSQIMETMEWINTLKTVVAQTDGMGGGSSAEPRTIEVPYQARQTALELLRKALYQDFMALDMDELRGGSLTNVAIRAAITNLEMKVNRYEWQVFSFVQQILRLMGVDTDNIRFNRQSISNEQETIQNIYMMRADIDRETALKLNPYINQEDIEGIMQNLDAEQISGIATAERLQQLLDGGTE